MLSNSENTTAFSVYGMSLESQWAISRNHKLTGEIAQSVSPDLISSTGSNEKATFHLNDTKNKAYSLKLSSSFPETRSKLEAFYQYKGINFQSFSSYYSNAVSSSWRLKADQWFWQRRFHFVFSVAKNNYDNPYLPVRYDGNTVFKNFSVSFRSNRWPSLSLGYIPSSQLSYVNDKVYENYYQTFNLNVSHRYKLGLAQGFSVLSMNRFYNDSRDSGFLYYNARNIFFTQNIQFLSYAANINISKSINSQYNLTTLDGGASARVWKYSSIGVGVKINQLNNQSLKVGVYGNERIVIPRVGEINAWIEKAYLPGMNGHLIKSELYNIGFTHYFNKKFL